MSNNSHDWHINKIMGGIAETVCRNHFEALGYAVETFGIENIAPQFCTLKSGKYKLGTHGENFSLTLQNMPDFLISRRHPQAVGNHDEPTLDAFLVDAKYRKTVYFDKFSEEIIDKYKNILDRDIHFFIYLVTKEAYYDSKNPKKYDKHIHIGHFPGKSAKTEYRWLSAGEKKLREGIIYQGMHDGENFNTIYDSIVHPALQQIL